MSEEETVSIVFNVTKTIRKRVEDRAESQGLNISNYMRFLIMKDLEIAQKNGRI